MNKTYWIRCEDTERDFTSKYHFNIVCISVKRPYGFCLTLYTILSFILSSEMDGGHMIIDSMILKKYIKLSIIRISKIDVRGHNCFLQLSEINSYDSINLWHTKLPKDICLYDNYLRWSLLYDTVEIIIAEYETNV